MSEQTTHGSIEGAFNDSDPLNETESFLVRILIGGNALGRIIYSFLHIIDGILTILMLGLTYSRIWSKVFMWSLQKSIEIQEAQ